MTTQKNPASLKRTAVAKLPAKKAAVKPSISKTASPRLSAPEKKAKHKVKVVRDSFTMPQDEYQKIAEIKAICLQSGAHVKKSEVLRAGLMLLCNLNAAKLKQALNNLEKIRTGRPKKHQSKS